MSLAFETSSLPRPSLATPGDYFALLKPRVMSLVVFTALVGLVVTPGDTHPVLAFASLLAIAVGAGASGALNMWWDADIDAVMTRTSGRPIPQGRVTRDEALAFGLALSALSVIVLGVAANWVAAALLAFTIFFYAVVYSMWLKRSTPQNIVIGGAAGAFPPVVGAASVSGSITLDSLLLFAIIFLWTPPHFWALALNRSEDYGRVGVPMLPNVVGADETRRQIVLYSVALWIVALLPLATGLGGPLYALAAGPGGAAFLWLAVRLRRSAAGAPGVAAAWRLFGYSIAWLFAAFAALLAERVLALRSMLEMMS